MILLHLLHEGVHEGEGTCGVVEKNALQAGREHHVPVLGRLTESCTNH